MRSPRRARYEDYTHELWVRALADDIDELEAVLDEHSEEDETAFRVAAEAFNSWKLESTRATNRMLFAVILALISALVSILVVLLSAQ